MAFSSAQGKLAYMQNKMCTISVIFSSGCNLLLQLQQFIGFTSPECLLSPGVPLNLVSPAPVEIPPELESSAIASLKMQSSNEEVYVRQHGEEYRY